MNDEIFNNYYYNFLDYDLNHKEAIVSSINRKKTINGFLYPVIISIYNNNCIYSITTDYFDDLKFRINKNKLIDKNSIISLLSEFFEERGLKVSIQSMLRMYKNKTAKIKVNDVIKIDETTKKQYFNSFEKNKSIKYKQDKWEKFKRYKYLNGIVEDNQLVSVGYVSNIDYGGANIVIHTKEKYRNKGYGKRIVEKISRDLIDNNIIPVYWVNIENEFSKKLALSTGFKEVAKEIVVRI